ncbi:hypothetical protein [Synechococcus sp. PCC 7336]|uniref:hypothetical protein n=1 Tax=Synechococcus sp. PCC 7336 TaxID=195250 RepID=UPI00034C8A19|nr:hypothetical protein [Synechococcus sp. PCC 7336]
MLKDRIDELCQHRKVGDFIKSNAYDFWTLLALSTLFGLAVYFTEQSVQPIVLQKFDIWFDGDIPRVIETAIQRNSFYNLRSTKVHPLFPLFIVPITSIISAVPGVSNLRAVQILIAISASIWLGLLYILFRAMGCRRPDSILFSVLASVSASSIFWFAVPESFSFGSVTILVAIACVAASEYIELPRIYFIIAGILSMSMTITNWMVGIIATVVSMPRRKAAKTLGQTFIAIAILWGIQRLFFANTQFFLDQRSTGLKQFTLNPESGGIFRVLKSFFFHSIVMPQWSSVENIQHPDFPKLITQFSSPGSGSLWGSIAVVLWTVLIGLGVYSLYKQKVRSRLRLAIGLTLLGQLLLHILYGTETFLFSLHFLPLLILVSAYGTLGKFRRISLLTCFFLTIFCSINNALMFSRLDVLLSSLS